MAIGTNKPLFTAGEARRGHRAGSSYGKLGRDSGARLDLTLVPDESGMYGCGLGLQPFASTIMISGTVYAVYLGRATGGKPLTSLSLITTVAGTGAAAGAAGFATTAAAPDFTSKADLTVQAVAAIDTTATAGRITASPVIVTGVKYAPAAGTHVWGFVLTTNATTQSTQWALTGEVGSGVIQVATGQTVAQAVVGKVYSTAARPAASITAFQAPQFYVA